MWKWLQEIDENLKSLKINYTNLNNVGFNEILFFFRGTIDLTLDL